VQNLKNLPSVHYFALFTVYTETIRGDISPFKGLTTKMKQLFGGFWHEDTGATTDWVVITGFVIALALSVASALSPGFEKRGKNMVDQVSIKTKF